MMTNPLLQSPEGSGVLVATGNRGKFLEITRLVAGLNVSFRSLADFPELTLPEEGEDYEENAVAKARAAALGSGWIAIADDSGIEVEWLNNGPGPLSARYGGLGLDDSGRIAKLLDALKDVPAKKRSARFVCVAALFTPDGLTTVRRGECYGRILESPRGEGGFGYDPIFVPEGYTESMAELTMEIKNQISHRSRAFRALQRPLRDLIRGRLEVLEQEQSKA